jgi:hypothetical protein
MIELLLDDDRCALMRGEACDLPLGENTIDAIVTDPPAGISFMGKGWDGDKGGRDQWIAWLAAQLAPAFRALKPGGHALVWAIPRTSHWTATALEMAGFEVRDVVYHGYGQGFPKSLDLSKAIDARLGAQREVVGQHTIPGAQMQEMSAGGKAGNAWTGIKLGDPVTAAAAWEGWGTALKPAAEHWILARKPLDGTYAENVLRWGVGGINVDGCRIGDAGGGGNCPGGDLCHCDTNAVLGGTKHPPRKVEPGSVGRWPANVVLSHDPRCVLVGEEEEEVSTFAPTGVADSRSLDFGMGARAVTGSATLAHEIYACVPGCPVRSLDDQTGAGKGSNGRKGGKPTTIGYKRDVAASKGGASRFFYVAKPSRGEKDEGLDHLPLRSGGEATGREDGTAGLNSPRAGGGRGGGARNFHPTPKGVALMRWLVRLITPPGGVVLDVFAGSGTTGVAAIAEGVRFVGVERDLDDATGQPLGYAEIALGRLRHALGNKGA